MFDHYLLQVIVYLYLPSIIYAYEMLSVFRSTAKGIQGALFNRVAAILASVAFGALITTHCAIPILLIAAILLVGGLMVYFLPNTTNAQIG